MADTITIPSPSVFLSSPTLKPTKPAPKSAPKRSSPPVKQPANPDAVTAGAVTKRKQSKSRNGCITCKAKRLKCDETKPTCQQCARRSVTCGGYKKDFKWRPFEETNIVTKPPVGKQKKASIASTTSQAPVSAPVHVPAPPPAAALAAVPAPANPGSPAASDTSNATIGNAATLPEGLIPLPPTSMPPVYVNGRFYSFDEAPTVTTHNSLSILTDPESLQLDDLFGPSSIDSAPSMFDDIDAVDTLKSTITDPSSLSSSHSPRLVDVLASHTDINTSSEAYDDWRSQFPESMYHPVTFNPQMESTDPLDDPMNEDDVEEILREPIQLNPDHEAWVMRLPSPSPSSSSSSSDGSAIFSSFLHEPIFDVGSPEMLTRRFDRDTCGVLSVKDGPTENPWRTLVWPLARDCPALYHAIASMTCFHSSREQPRLRVNGIDHMRTAIHSLANGIQNMRFDAAIATTLALAFSESWDQHISTGINHIKGAKILINQALVRLRDQPSVPKEEVDRLRFLCNTWIYMDVIARITSVDDDYSNDFGVVSAMFSGPMEAETQLDPLMGCASTLFPIVGQVANLVRRVCRSESNSPAIISQAMELKSQIENWVPPAFLEQPEDPTSPVVHSIQTAEAYRWATLLYLHQAVPEIPSLSSAELAKKVMVYLATVPPTSRAVIVQIYPLAMAGCEAVEDEDREWVAQRWTCMAQKMSLGIIDRCAEVTKEVWDRRDAWYAQKARSKRASTSVFSMSNKRELNLDDNDLYSWLNPGPSFKQKKRAHSGLMGDTPSSKSNSADKKARNGIGMEKLEPELTVRGRLHWVGVMTDWKWEILLG